MKKLWLLMTALILGACGNQTVQEGEITEIRIAQLIDEDNPDSGVIFEDFRAALEDYLGIPVTGIEGVAHLPAIEAMRAGNLEIMWGSPFVYLLASQAADVERLVVTDSPTAQNKTVFITANDEVESISDLEGRSFAFISASSSSGFLYPMYHLMNELNLDQDSIMASTFFRNVSFSGRQDASVMGVIHGDYDGAAVGNLNLQNFIASGMISADDFRVIATTETIPFPGYIVSRRLPNELLEQIRDFMLAYDQREFFENRFRDGDVRFALPDPAQLAHFHSMVEALNLDLESQD
jgi:phosphonate transport system substrate-binding protein